MNVMIRKYATGFFEIFAWEFPRLLKEKKVSILAKDGSVMIRFSLRMMMEEIKRTDCPTANGVSTLDIQTMKNLLKSVFDATSEQASINGSTLTCYTMDVDLINEVTGVKFSITDNAERVGTSLFQGK